MIVFTRVCLDGSDAAVAERHLWLCKQVKEVGAVFSIDDAIAWQSHDSLSWPRGEVENV